MVLLCITEPNFTNTECSDAVYGAAAFRQKNDRSDTHVGLFRAASVLFTDFQPLNCLIPGPFPMI